MATKTKKKVAKTSTKSAAKTNLTPLNDNVLVQRLEAEERSAGGILLPDSAKEKPQEGVVIAVGDGKLNDSGERVAPQIQKNDRIIFSSYAGNEISVGGQKYLIVREDEILAIVS